MRALKQASGEYFMFVDSDDYIAQDYIFRFMSEVEKEPYDIVVAGFTKDIEGKKVLHDIKDSEWTLVCYPLACAKMFRTAFIREHDIDFSKVRVGEDIYFSIAIFYENVKYKIIHYFGYYYRFNAFSTTESLTYDREHEKYVAEMFRVFLEKYAEDLRGKETDDRVHLCSQYGECSDHIWSWLSSGQDEEEISVLARRYEAEVSGLQKKSLLWHF